MGPREKNRRLFLKALAGAWAMPDSAAADTEQNNDDNADFTLSIAPLEIKITARRKIKTTGYNGGVPGPVLRVRKGRTVTIDVYNDSNTAELVHFLNCSLRPK